MVISMGFDLERIKQAEKTGQQHRIQMVACKPPQVIFVGIFESGAHKPPKGPTNFDPATIVSLMEVWAVAFPESST